MQLVSINHYGGNENVDAIQSFILRNLGKPEEG
jgi:hypothetical protein